MGMAVLPDDFVGVRIYDDHAIVLVVVGQHVSVGQRQCQRGLIERAGALGFLAPQQPAGRRESLDRPRIGVVGREEHPGAHLVGI